MPIQVSVLLETYSNTGINWKRKKRLTLNVIFQILPLIDQEGTRSETATARASAEIYRWFNLPQLQLKIQLKKKKNYSYKIQLQLKIHFEILFKICILSTSDTWECSLPSPLKFSPPDLKAKCSFCPLYPQILYSFLHELMKPEIHRQKWEVSWPQGTYREYLPCLVQTRDSQESLKKWLTPMASCSKLDAIS